MRPSKISENGEIKKLLREQTKELAQHMGALSEDFQHKTKFIAEQFLDVKKELGEIRQTQDSHTEMIATLMEDTTIIKTDIEFIKGGLKKKVDIEKFA